MRLVRLPFHSLKGHTLCIGAASTAAAVGLPDWLIKITDRWSSYGYQLYIRTPREVLPSAAPRMASVTLKIRLCFVCKECMLVFYHFFFFLLGGYRLRG